MFKTLLPALATSAALASPASAQWIEPGSIADHAFRSGMYQQQVIESRVRYYNATGYDGFAPAWQNPNAQYVRCGGGVQSLGYLRSLNSCGNNNLYIVNPPPVIYAPAPAYGGGCGPRPWPTYGGGWSVGVSVGFGGRW